VEPHRNSIFVLLVFVCLLLLSALIVILIFVPASLILSILIVIPVSDIVVTSTAPSLNTVSSVQSSHDCPKQHEPGPDLPLHCLNPLQARD
jgi:hypothetical protein